MSKFWISLFLPFLIIFISACSSSPKPEPTPSNDTALCPLSGHSYNWKLSYCRLKTGIQDLHSRVITSCLKEQDSAYKDQEDCLIRRQVKKKMCSLQKKLGRLEKGEIHCYESKENDQIWGAPTLTP